jgi:hypothetical protein
MAETWWKMAEMSGFLWCCKQSQWVYKGTRSQGKLPYKLRSLGNHIGGNLFKRLSEEHQNIKIPPKNWSQNPTIPPPMPSFASL